MPGPRSSPTHLTIGYILAPRGLRGELKVRILEEHLQNLEGRNTLFIGDPPTPFPVESWKARDRGVILKLRTVETRDQAEALRRMPVSIPLEEAVPLEEDEYYVFQIIGLDVFTDEGEHLGTVQDVIFTGSNEVYVVQGPRGEVLIPAIADVVQEVDLERGRMRVVLMKGLLRESGG